jgi:uncharacterized membrane protein YdjX (TVP38/TMEM64 family)
VDFRPHIVGAGAHVRRWAPLVVVLGAAAAVYASGVNRYVSLDELRLRHDELKAFVSDHFWLSLMAYTAVFALITATAIPGAVFVQLAGGLLFGAAVGGTATALAATAGAVAIYFAARSAFGDQLRERAMRSGGVARRWSEGLHRDAFWYLLGLRLPPVVPFVLVNIVAGLAAVPLRSYVAATLLGVWPSCLVYGSIGMGLDRTFARDEALRLFAPAVLWPLVGLGLLSLIPAAVKLWRFLRRPEPL